MSKSIKVKEPFLKMVIGFNNSGAPLGARNDLHLLYEMAKRTKQQHILDMFEEQLSKEEIDDVKAEKFLSKKFGDKQVIRASRNETSSPTTKEKSKKHKRNTSS